MKESERLPRFKGLFGALGDEEKKHVFKKEVCFCEDSSDFCHSSIFLKWLVSCDLSVWSTVTLDSIANYHFIIHVHYGHVFADTYSPQTVNINLVFSTVCQKRAQLFTFAHCITVSAANGPKTTPAWSMWSRSMLGVHVCLHEVRIWADLTLLANGAQIHKNIFESLPRRIELILMA